MFSRYLKRLFLGSFFLIPFASPVGAQEIHLPLLWKTELHMVLESAPTVADINGDGQTEVVVAGREKLFALGAKGQILWQWHTRKRFCTYPAVLPRGKQPALIFVADNSGLFTCLNGKGQKVWQKELDGPSSWSAAVVYEKPKKKPPLVFQTDKTGAVWCFNALTGQVLWKTRISGKPASPSLGDLNGDGQPELVLKTGNGTLVALSLVGNVLWKRKIGGPSPDWATASPVIFGAADGSARIAAATNNGDLILMDGSGKTLWSYPTGQPIASTLSVGDLDQNGLADLFVVTQLGRLFRFDETGAMLWQIDTQGRSLAPGAILDINGDGTLEYILCTQRGHLMVLNPSGSLLFEHQFNTRTINVTPAFGFITKKQGTLDFAITGGESGQVFCFGTAARSHSLQQWTAYRANPQNTGSWFGLTQSSTLRMIPQNLNWNQVLVGEPIRYSIWNPQAGNRLLKAVANCTSPDGKRQSAFTRLNGKQSQLSLPVDFVSPGVYHFSWWVEDTHGQKMAVGERNIVWQPFVNDRALVSRAIRRLRDVAKEIHATLPLSNQALLRRADALSREMERLRPLQEAVAGASFSAIARVMKETKALTLQAKRAFQIAQIVNQAKLLGSGTSLVACEGSFWENRNVDKQIPAEAANPVKIAHAVVPGETQPLPLLVMNITNRPLQVRLKADSVSRGLHLRLLHSVPVPTNMGEISWDPLPDVSDPWIISVPPLESREFWLDVQIDRGVKGPQALQLELLALNGARVLDGSNSPQTVPPPATHILVRLDVLPFQMAPPGDFRLCTWSPTSGRALPNLLSHGNNVFIVPQPRVIAHKNGRLTGLDFTSIDSLLPGFQGYDVFLLISGFPALPGSFEDPLYKTNLKKYVQDVVIHLASKGIDRNHFAFYPIDEPGGHGWASVHKLVKWGKAVHSVDPKVKIYVDGGGDVPMFQEMAHCVNIWTPPIDWLGQDLPQMRIMRQSHQHIWSYNCSYSYSRPIGVNLKNTNLLAEYRDAALFALRHGGTGIGYWCYNATPGDLWGRIRLEYNLVYPGHERPVNSRRWEAVRESVEDARILLALKAFAQQNEDNPKAQNIVRKIHFLFQKDLPALVDPGFQAMRLGLSREAIDHAFNEVQLKNFRAKMLACVRSIVRLQNQ